MRFKDMINGSVESKETETQLDEGIALAPEFKNDIVKLAKKWVAKGVDFDFLQMMFSQVGDKIDVDDNNKIYFNK